MGTTVNINPAIFAWQVNHGRRLSNAELATKAGINVQKIYRLRAGKVKRINLETLELIAGILECNPLDLLETK